MKSPNSLCHALSTFKACAKTSYQKSVLILVLLISSQGLLSQQLAFPTAQGAGAYTTGGRGGIVVRVTNLNDSGAGSLREALLMTVPRTIVFDVSGKINLTSLLAIPAASSNFTVAGQTAPQGGITITGRPIQMGASLPNYVNVPCNNAIWRYIRFRNGSYTGVNDVYEHNGFISVGTERLILDHCSFSFCDDQAISMDSYYGDLKNITIQRSLFSENATQIITGLQGSYPRGNMTFINNLFVDTSQRTPNIGGNLQWDIINNVHFNWVSRLVNANNGSPNINSIGNYYKRGSYTNTTTTNVVQNVTPKIYSANNYHPTLYPTPKLDDRNLWTSFNVAAQALPDGHFTTTQFPLLGAAPIIQTAASTYNDVLSDVGANAYLNADGTFGTFQDSFDTKKIGNVLSNISSDPYNNNWTQPILPLNSRSGAYDTDNDGMPDVWEIANGLNPNNASDRNIVQSDGYTNLEYFLNGMSLQTTAITANAGADVGICTGNSTTLMATGGSIYRWNTGATTQSITVSPSSTTTYTVTVSDASGGNSDTDDVVVTVKSMPAANAGGDVSICQGTGVSLTASGGGSYLWSTGATTASINVNPSSTTIYTVDVTQNGCTATDDVKVTVNPLPSVNAGTDVTITLGQSVTLTATGATTYTWNTGATGTSINVSPTLTTTYTVTGTNANGCSKTDTVKVTVQTGDALTIIANAGADVSICSGSSTTLTATGGSTYLWSNGATTASITVSPTTTATYTVTAFNASGTSSDTDDVKVTVNPLPSLNAGTDETINLGQSVTLTATGAANYTWNTGAIGPSINVSPTLTTTYTVTGTNANGCSKTDTVKVNVQTGETLTISANAGTDVSICLGNSTTLTATGGSTYLWSNGATTAGIEVTPNTTTLYTVTVYDSTGINSDTDDVKVTVNQLPTANAGLDVSTCRGTSVTLTATGDGSYLWSNGATSASITVYPNNTTTYMLEVTKNGCTATDDVKVTVNPLPSVNAGADVTISLGQSVTLTATGATTYTWNTGATGASIDVSPTLTTTYTITGTNSNGCSKTDTVKVNVQTGDALTINANAGADVSICSGSSTTLTATGGSTYLWSNGATTGSITISPTTTQIYTVTAFNASGTSSNTDDVKVTVNPLPTANAGADVATCRGTSVTLTATGGGSYLWSNGATSASITVNPNNTTTYTVEVTKNGCTATDDVKVTVNPLPSVNAGTDVTINLGQSVTLTATGATLYTWNTGDTGPSLTVRPTETTIYTVKGTNANGCSKSDSVMVHVQKGNSLTAYAGADVSICSGNSTVLTATGGSSYLWSNGATTASITVAPNITTTYTVIAYDSTSSFSDTDDVRVTVNQAPSIEISPDFTINFGQIITLYAFGGSSYVWSTGETTNSIKMAPSVTTTYTVVGTANGCEGTASVTITVKNENDYVSNAGANRSTCQSSGVTLTAEGGDRYLWSTGETTKSIVVNPNTTTNYSVTVYTHTAEINDDVIVTVNPKPTVEITNGGEVTILQGEYITLSATGANRYEWNNGATLPNIAVNPSTTTTYSVTGFIGDCSDAQGVRVKVVPVVLAFAGVDQSICKNEEITLTATGGDEFLWNTGATTASITVTPDEDTEYSVTVYNDLDYSDAKVMVYVNECSSTGNSGNSENPEGSESLEYFEFLAYPNPTAGELNIKISGLLNVSNIALYDLSGKMLFEESISNDEQHYFVKKLDLSPYADGLYLLKLVDGTRAITKKIVIHK